MTTPTQDRAIESLSLYLGGERLEVSNDPDLGLEGGAVIATLANGVDGVLIDSDGRADSGGGSMVPNSGDDLVYDWAVRWNRNLDRQPRERQVNCRKCGRTTWDVDAVCERCWAT